MYMLLRWDYYRIYDKEHRDYINERLAREEKKKAKTVIRDITGLNKKKAPVEVVQKEMFKMARFKNIPAKVSHRRCYACDNKTSKE
ncbi:hypothetical protein Bhyg_14856 [Pseudolycoriella hygida]|uniref:Uncharacterized protein n=1 Tax=Pseudolycoriella hygida TaxID=35572 RepID=A0A9Q0RXW3_9DIPT|nr:hypothetical protein Bhyg_14856 [Pseudolycoriella hygida]